jgi:hypothetical protein
MMLCIDDFACVIKAMTPQIMVSSLITVYDARLMTEGFHNNWRYLSFYDNKGLFSVTSRHISRSNKAAQPPLITNSTLLDHHFRQDEPCG